MQTDSHLAVLIPHAGLKAGADVGVGPHVHGLLLAPHELSIGVAPQLPLHQIKGEGAQLHHTTVRVSCSLMMLGGRGVWGDMTKGAVAWGKGGGGHTRMGRRGRGG